MIASIALQIPSRLMACSNLGLLFSQIANATRDIRKAVNLALLHVSKAQPVARLLHWAIYIKTLTAHFRAHPVKPTPLHRAQRRPLFPGVTPAVFIQSRGINYKYRLMPMVRVITT